MNFELVLVPENKTDPWDSGRRSGFVIFFFFALLKRAMIERVSNFSGLQTPELVSSIFYKTLPFGKNATSHDATSHDMT